VLKKHRGKQGAVWSAYDLSVELPSCQLFKPNGVDICGEVPSAAAGTTNYWSHLWTHHRMTWWELKRKDGKLNPAGDAELTRLKQGLANMAASQNHNRGGVFLSASLPTDQKETMDRVVSEMIVDDDLPFSAASTPGFRHMMATATNGAYDRCCSKTVEQHAAWPCGHGGPGRVHRISP